MLIFLLYAENFGENMRKRRIISLLIMLALLCACLSSCIVVKGTPGLSAYEIAVQNGFQGTQSEWLDSLKGENVIGDQTINQDITKNEITINGSTVDVSYATNKGLKSVVSILCGFTSRSSVTREYSSAGSGVFYKINADGSALVITNYHVVFDSQCNTENKISDDISLYLYGAEMENRAISAEFVGGSLNYDIAILKVNACDALNDAISSGSVAPAQISKEQIYAGQTVIAIGNPEANGISATTGVVSVDSEYISMIGADEVTEVEFRVIRTDTAINSGNSGGGLFNAKGELVGIVNAKIMSTDVENIGYAIPMGVAMAVSENLLYYCLDKDCETVMKTTVGISVQIVDKWSEYDTSTGMMKKFEKSEIVLISEGSLAHGVFEVGDTIKAIQVGDGEKITITRQYQIIDSILSAHVGDEIKTTVVTAQGEEIVRTVTVTEQNIASYK